MKTPYDSLGARSRDEAALLQRGGAEAQALVLASCADELVASLCELALEVHATGFERLEACVATATVSPEASSMSWPLGSTAAEVGRTA
jgi:hypothetical protein